MLRKSNSTPWTTSSCYLCECVSLFICVLAQWSAQGVALPSSKCMLGYAELTLNGSRSGKRLSEWMNVEIGASSSANSSQRPGKTFSAKCIHVISPIHRNDKRKRSLMFVYIAAATRYFIRSSHLSEKHRASYYTHVLTTSTSLGAWHMDCVCAANVTQVTQTAVNATRMFFIIYKCQL